MKIAKNWHSRFHGNQISILRFLDQIYVSQTKSSKQFEFKQNLFFLYQNLSDTLREWLLKELYPKSGHCIPDTLEYETKCLEEQDKSSDIEQQPPFGDRKISNIQLQNRGGLQNQQEHHIILTKYEAVHPTAVSENNSSSGMLIIQTISQTVCINIYLKGPNNQRYTFENTFEIAEMFNTYFTKLAENLISDSPEHKHMMDVLSEYTKSKLVQNRRNR